MFDLLIPSLSPLLFQLVKKQIWRAHSSKSDDSRGCLSSIVLDASDKLPHQKSLKENRFIYRFVHRDLSSINVKALGGDPLSFASSLKSDMDCTLRSGDYVVQLFSCNTFLHDVTLAKFGLPYDQNQGSNPPSYTYYNNYGHIYIYIYRVEVWHGLLNIFGLF